MPRHDDAAEPAGRPAGRLSTACRRISAATASPACSSRSRRCRADQFATWAQGARGQGRRSTAAAMPSCRKPSSYVKPMTYGAVAPGLFDAIVADTRRRPIRSCRRQPQPASDGAGGMSMFGKLTWDAIPFDEPIPLITSLVVILALGGVAVWVTGSRAGGPICGTSASRPPTTSASASCTSCSALRDAGARLRRRDHDARAAVARDRRSRRAICRPSITTRSSPRTARS